MIEIDYDETFDTFKKKIIKKIDMHESDDLIITRDDNAYVSNTNDILELIDGDTITVSVKYLNELMYLRDNRIDHSLCSLKRVDLKSFFKSEEEKDAEADFDIKVMSCQNGFTSPYMIIFYNGCTRVKA